MRPQEKSHKVWNKHNSYDKIKRGNYKNVIHHKDENRENNDISNLQKMTHGEHSRLHRIKSWKNGIYDGEETRKKFKIIGFTGRKHSKDSLEEKKGNTK